MAYVVKASSIHETSLKRPIGHASDTVFRNLIDTAPWPVLITNERAEILYVNAAWEHITGYTSVEVLGKNPSILKSGETPDHIFDVMWKKLKSGHIFISDKVINRKKNGRLFTLRSTAYPVRVGAKLYYVQAFDDITAQKHAEEYRSTFLGVAAHDMRAPLSSLAIMSELMALHSPHYSREATELHEEVVRLQELASSLLDMQAFEDGKMDLSRCAVDLGALIRETVDTVQNAHQERSIKVDDSLDVFVDADKVRIKRVIVNLLDNAIRHSSDGAPVELKARKEGMSVRVSITNRGSHIPRQQRKNIFKSFYKISNASRGYGLGLYIASEIIHAHGGKIWVESRERNPYTTFHFTLPLAKEN